MKEQLISFETAKLAKEAGFKFNEDSFDSFDDFYRFSGYYKYGKIGNGKWSLESVFSIATLHWGDELTETIDVPTQSLLQKWLREAQGIYVEVYHDLTLDYKSAQYYTNWGFINDKESDKIKYGGQRIGGGYDEKAEWKTYETAFENGLTEALKMLVNKSYFLNQKT